MLVNLKKTAVSCLFMLVHIALILLTNTSFDFKNVFVNVEIDIN